MSEEKDTKKEDGATAGKSEPQKIEVEVGTKAFQDLMKRLTEKEEEAKKLTKDLQEAMEAKKQVEQTLEEEKTVKEDYEEKLKILTEQKFAEKKKILMDAAKGLVVNAERVKQIEEGIKTPEDLKATEFMLKTLDDAIKAGEKAHKRSGLLETFPDAKEKIETAGTMEDLTKLEEELKKLAEQSEKEGPEKQARLEKSIEPVGKGGGGQVSLEQQSGQGVFKGKDYESQEAMIRDLYKKQHSGDPEEAAEAKAILDELFRKWSSAVKKKYGPYGEHLELEKKKQPSLRKITKEGGAA